MGHGAWDYAVGGWRSASLEVGGSWQKSPAFAKATARQGDHPSSPYGLRRDKEDIRLRPTGYAATRRTSVFALRATPRQGGQGTEIFLWERLLAAILQFERF